MISIIICSRNHDISQEQRFSIESTIGVPHEIIVIDNSENKYNIFSAYNEGVQRSKYNILCFMHDDVICHKKNWGRTLSDYFKNSHIGLVGVSGPFYLPKVLAPWWSIYNKDFDFSTIAQCIQDTNRYDRNTSRMSIIPNTTLDLQYSRVVVCDGLFLSLPKKLFSEIRFDDRTFNGFHFYDLDISMQVNALGYHCIASYELGLEHISSPESLNKAWIIDLQKFFHKWKNVLPKSIISFSWKQKKLMELNSIKIMNNILVQYKFSLFKYYSISQFLKIIEIYMLKNLIK